MNESAGDRAQLKGLLDHAIAAVEAFRAADEARFNKISSERELTTTHIRDRREWKFISRSVSATHALKSLVDIRNEF